MDKIGKILIPALARRGLGGAARSSLVCFLAQEWGKGRFEAISFSRGILKLSTASSSAASELHMEQEKLINHLNEKIGKPIVKSIRFQQGKY